MSGAVRKYICQQQGREKGEREVAVNGAERARAIYLLMALYPSCLGESSPGGKSDNVWKKWL